MPARVSSTGGKNTEKSSKHASEFTRVEDIRQSLRSQDERSLIETLVTLRNQFTIKYDEITIPANDPRLVLAKSWLDLAPEAHEIFELWERSNLRQQSLLTSIISLLSTIISLLSSHYTYHSLANPIIKNLLSPQWIHKLNSQLGTSHSELLLVTLKLFNSMSNFASGRERKTILEAFAWDSKSLPKLLHMRRRGKESGIDSLARPDIRTLYILFLLSFMDITTSSAVKAQFLEQRRELFAPIFKGLHQDSYTVVRRVLEVCWTGLWLDPKVKRTLKVAIFTETTLGQIARLYDRNTPEGPNPDEVPADLVHHFLLAICTRPGTGVCFKERGWYPREDTGDQVPDEVVEMPATTHKSGRIYNKILSQFLKGLKVNEDSRQQELALRILEACPELVAGYWPAAALTLEPRLSSKWIANIAFFGSVISLPVPHASFLLPGTTNLYQPSPPSLSTILENILPSVNIRIHLSRGLQSPSMLVQHCTALALAKCLMKYSAVLQQFRIVENALEEDEAEGQWANRRREVEREVRRRVPDFQVIVGLAQKAAEVTSEMKQQVQQPSNSAKTALLSECAQRLLWLYHRCLPALVAEARFDVGKLLQGLHVRDALASPTNGTIAGLETLRQLHVLRLLQESDQFSWSGKIGSSRSNFDILLRLFVSTKVPATRVTIAALLRHTLSRSILFQHDPDEVGIWLDSLPVLTRAQGAEAPDGTALGDESDAVILFLDDCAQRCVKTPYRYLEDLQALWSPSDVPTDDVGHAHPIVEHPDGFPSPLLLTVLEQFGAKLGGNLLMPSDILAIATFIRKLVLGLASKASTLGVLDAATLRVKSILQSDKLPSLSPAFAYAIQREARLLSSSLVRLTDASVPMAISASPAVEEFILQVEILPTPPSLAERRQAAFELVDWLRLSDVTLDGIVLHRLLNVLHRFYQPAVKEFCTYLSPDQSLLWEEMSHLPLLDIDFPLLFLHTHDAVLTGEACRKTLADAIFQEGTNVINVKRAFCLIDHRLLVSPQDVERSANISLITSILQRAQASFQSVDINSLKQHLFRLKGLRQCASQPLTGGTFKAFDEFLQAALDIAKPDDRELVRDFVNIWSLTLQEELSTLSKDQITTATFWIRYMDTNEVFALFDFLNDKIEVADEQLVIVEEGLLAALGNRLDSEDIPTLISRLPQLLDLQRLLPRSTDLENILATAINGVMPLGLYPCSGPTSFGRSGQKTVAAVVLEARRRWSHRSRRHAQVDISPFLDTGHWTDATVQIITNLLYLQPSSQAEIIRWLQTESAKSCSLPYLVRILHALFDCSSVEDVGPLVEAGGHIATHFGRICQAMVEHSIPDEILVLCAESIPLMVEVMVSSRQQLLVAWKDILHGMSADAFDTYVLDVAIRLGAIVGADSSDLVDKVVERGLMWAASCISSSEALSPRSQLIVRKLNSLLMKSSGVKPYLAEPVVTAAVQHRISDRHVLGLTHRLISQVTFKPATVNRFLQSIVQHPQLYTLCGSAEDPHPREDIIAVLHTLFYLHPSNTCQPSHIEPLQSLYRGSLSSSDLKLLSIFQLFETTRRASAAVLFTRWSSSPESTSDSALEALQSLDPNRTFRSCLAFPQGRRMLSHSDEFHDSKAENDQLYDPVFIILLFAQMLSTGVPTSALGWVQLFRTNVVSLLIHALSADDDDLREAALAQIAGLTKCLQDADMQEKPHVTHILDMLKNLFAAHPAGGRLQRLPAYTTLHLAHSLRGIFYPSNFIYPLTARFLLQRPELDAGDVPMLYTMLYDSGDQWRKERAWIVRFLGDGMVGREEWRVLKRRHVWDLMASMFHAEERDKALRYSVLELLAKLTREVHATTSLVLKSSLLSWIELQLQNYRAEEAVSWLKILENIISSVNSPKFEAATDGEWRAVLCRCLLALLDKAACTHEIFVQLVPLVLRLSLLPGPSVAQLKTLISRAVVWLSNMESSLDVSKAMNLLSSMTSSGFGTSAEAGPGVETAEGWGACVVALWRAAMTLDEKCAHWEDLTCRLLVWRAIVGEERCPTGEWARKETMRNLRSE